MWSQKNGVQPEVCGREKVDKSTICVWFPWSWCTDGAAMSKPPPWSSSSLGSSLGLGAFSSSPAPVPGPAASRRCNLRFSSKGRSSRDPPGPAVSGHSAGCCSHSMITCPRAGGAQCHGDSCVRLLSCAQPCPRSFDRMIQMARFILPGVQAHELESATEHLGWQQAS